jgi:hypothetical protein
MPAALLTPVLISAAVGAVTAAISGGNILKGALLGAVGGAIGGMFMGAGAAPTSAATSAMETTAASGLASGVEGAAGATVPAASEGAFSGFVGEAPWVASGGGPMEFTQAASNVSAPATAVPSTSTGIAEAPTTSGLASSGGHTGINVIPEYSGLGPDVTNTGVGVPDALNRAGDSMQVKQPSAIESMWERVFGKDGAMEKPMFRGLAGSALQGYASGANQQKLLDARKEEIENSRANARFGTQTSRFAPVGLVATAKTPYRG